jgi:hypothetical protein
MRHRGGTAFFRGGPFWINDNGEGISAFIWAMARLREETILRWR